MKIFAVYILGCIKMILMSLAAYWLTVNGFSVAAKIVVYGAMSVAWKKQMEATIVQSAKTCLSNFVLDSVIALECSIHNYYIKFCKGQCDIITIKVIEIFIV